MKPEAVLAATWLTACEIAASPSPESAAPLPHGMSSMVVSETVSAAASRRLEARSGGGVVDEQGCGAGAYQAIELVADVAPSPGRETILASYAHGVVVLDREGDVVASTTGYRCAGSSDEVEAVAAGDAFGDPTIVVVTRTGGRREFSTVVGLFRIGFGGRLDPVFTATVEEHSGERSRRGAIDLLPGALVHRLPDGRHGFFVFDPVGRVYREPSHPLDDPAHEPPLGAAEVPLGRMR
jgi:hypothetical protein